MTIQEAKANVGKLVMSRDMGNKLLPKWFLLKHKPHGPYRLTKITREGRAILEGKEDQRIPPSLLLPYVPDPTEAEVAAFLKEYDEGKHPLSPEDLAALERASIRFKAFIRHHFNKDAPNDPRPKI